MGGDITVLVYWFAYCGIAGFGITGGGVSAAKFGYGKRGFFLVFFETVSFWYWGFCWGFVR